MILACRRDSRTLGARIARVVGPGDLVLLCGGLGVGKTFLARAVLRRLGVPADSPVRSPTFSLVHEFALGPLRVLHVDVYRLLDSADPLAVAKLGVADARREGALVLAEWAHSRVDELGGRPDLVVTLSEAGPTARSVTLEGPLAPRLFVE